MLQKIHVHKTLFSCAVIYIHPLKIFHAFLFTLHAWTPSTYIACMWELQAPRHYRKTATKSETITIQSKFLEYIFVVNTTFTWMQDEVFSSNLALTCQVIFNYCMKHWTGPCGVKLRIASPNCHVRSALLWNVMQHRLVIPCLHFGTTYQYHLQGQRYSKEKRQQVWNYLTQCSFLVHCPVPYFLKKHVSKMASVSVFRERNA